MSYYKCRKCEYKTKFFRDIKNHINIQKTCINDFTCLDLTNDQILIMTLMPYVNNRQNIISDKVKRYKHMYINKNILLDELYIIDKDKKKKCKYCNITFSKIRELKEHIILDCFEKEMEKNNIEKISNNNINIESLNSYNNSKIENIQGNIINHNNNITNNNNIVLSIDSSTTTPVPFDENWDISALSEPVKCQLLYSKLMYTRLLNEILKNKCNLNVVIDKEKDFGIVYKNKFDKYIKMEISEIISNSMEKIHKNLLDINKELNDMECYEDTFLEYKRKDINNKYQCYINNNDTKKNVDKCISNIFNDKREESHKIMKDYLSNINQLSEY
jgi:hypothetical protein